MAWEIRNNQAFYYRYEWSDGQAKKIYCGTGGRAIAAAAEDKVKKKMKAHHAYELKVFQESLGPTLCR